MAMWFFVINGCSNLPTCEPYAPAFSRGADYCCKCYVHFNKEVEAHATAAHNVSEVFESSEVPSVL